MLLWTSAYPVVVKVTLGAAVLGPWIALVVRVRGQVVRSLQTVSNLLAAVREGDFSIRARGAAAHDPFGQVMLEINTLADALRSQRLGTQEATALLRAVMAEINVAIFAFDSQQRLVLVNRCGERLLGRPAGELIGRFAAETGLSEARDTSNAVRELNFAGGSGRWEIRRTKFWQGGEPHELLVLSDLSQPLREQERDAWKRLIRVISHELNNSLAPIKSIAGSLKSLLGRPAIPDDWQDDARRGLAVIESRVESLSRFTSAYARLARLPAPARRPLDVPSLVRRLVDLDHRIAVTVVEGPPLSILADGDQLEQLLINLLRNAVDAALEGKGGVRVGWSAEDEWVSVWIEDEGPGLPSTANLFVPFFTTKPGGSGVGLVLARQIAEAHGGSVVLENRAGESGVKATLRIPVMMASSAADTA